MKSLSLSSRPLLLCVAGALSLLFAPPLVPAAHAGECHDTWITSAVRDVTGRYPDSSGSSGDCSPDYYATNYGQGHWSDYQDLLNKVRVKKTGQGVAYTFLAPNHAGWMGHVAWGFVMDDGRYYAGSTDGGSNPWSFVLRTYTFNSQAEMLKRFKTYFSSPWDYTEYRFAVTPSRNVASAKNQVSQISSYFLGGNNCMDHTYKVLNAYGMRNMPWTQTNWAPRKWFADFPGTLGYFSNVRGVRTSAATKPIPLVSRTELATRPGVGFVAPRNTQPRPSASGKRAAYARLTGSANTRGARGVEVENGLPKASARQLKVPDVKGRRYDYQGVGLLIPYSNEGAPDPNRASGAAALATIADFYSLVARNPNTPLVKQTYETFPPDISIGIQGHSRARMQSALQEAGFTSPAYRGVDALQSALRQNMPALVLLDVGAAASEGWSTWGTFWTVAYGYDGEGVYLSNWPGDGKCAWGTFKEAWNTDLTRTAGLNNVFLCPQPKK